MVSHHPVYCCSHRYCGSGDIMVLVSYVMSQNHATKVLSNIMDESPLKANRQLAKFGGHRPCGIEDVMIFSCNVISQDHMNERSCNFMGRSPSRQVTVLPSLVAIGSVSENMILVCYIILKDHMIKESWDFLGKFGWTVVVKTRLICHVIL